MNKKAFVVLMAEDNEHDVLATRRAWKKHNIANRVAVVEDGAEALELFQKAPKAFDLLITDLTMPKLSGVQLAAAIRRLRSDIPILLTTGYPGQEDSEDVEALNARAILTKPVSVRKLSQSVRDALDAREQRPPHNVTEESGRALTAGT